MKKKYPLILPVILSILTLLVLTGCRQPETSIDPTENTLAYSNLTELVLSPDAIPDDAEFAKMAMLETIDARNVQLSIADYGHLKQLVPHAQILWNVPFQGEYLAEDTCELQVETMNQVDMDALEYFPALQVINLGQTQEYELIEDLQNRYPHVSLDYMVPVNENWYPCDVISLQIDAADLSALSVLPYLPQVTEVSLIGETIDYEAVALLMDTYPDISFLFNVELFGKTVPNTATMLDLSGIKMKATDEVESYLKYFINLERVEMCECGISSEDMDAMAKRHPEIKFVWTIRIRGGKLRTDATAFIPYKLGYGLDNPIFDYDCTELKYCTDLICLDLGHMKIRDISFLQYMPNMKYLILIDMPCRDFSVLENLNELIYLELFNVQFTQHEVLLHMTKLEDLNISSTPTTDIDVLKQMTWLKRLWITRTRLNSQQIEELKAALPDTQIVPNAAHSTAAGWRNHQNYRDMRDLLGMFYMD